MERFPHRPAVGLFVALILAFGSGQSTARERLAGPVPATVTAVVDGDTLEVRARVWLGQEIATRVRLGGIDAPELRSRCAQERALALRAADFLETRLAAGGAALSGIRLHDIENGKYAGRVLARVETADGQDLARLLLAAGLAQPYHGGRRTAWCAADQAP